MSERTSGGFGAKLRGAREQRGISLRQIANATKISTAALEALERNDISRLPGGIFSRAFVRAYAVEVGLDPEDMIREFIGQFPNDSVTAGHPTVRYVEDRDSIESDRRVAWTALRLAVVAVPLMAAVIYFGMVGRRAPAVGGAAVAAVPTELQISLVATSPTRISIAVDGAAAVDRQLEAGEKEVVQVRRDVVLRTEDAGAFGLTINGADAKPLGQSGQAVTARIDLTNFRDYLAPR